MASSKSSRESAYTFEKEGTTMANAQTKASKKYREKAGIVSKSFEMPRELSDRFREACEKAGVGQAAQIRKMMEDFIKEVESPST